MRVLHWFPNYFHGGGVANAITGLATAQAERGDAVAIAGVRDDVEPMYGEQEQHAAVTLLAWQPAVTMRVGTLTVRPPAPAARRMLRDWKPDVVHVHAEFAPDNFWATSVFRCPILLSFHGALHPEVFAKGRAAQKHLYLAAAQRTLYRRVARFVALCPAEAADIERVLPERAVDTIPLGPGRHVACMAAHGGPNEPGTARARGIAIVSVGRLDVYTKGLDLLVAAFAKAKAELGGALGHLTFVGPDWLDGRRALEDQVRRAGLCASVSFAGGVAVADVARYLADADMYVQLSRHDAFPLSVVDALACGMPSVLSSAIGTTSYPEVAAMPSVRITEPDVDAAASALTQLVAEYRNGAFTRADAAADARRLFAWDRIADAHDAAYRAAAS
jgi:glycosyltransferase involved in cell wall biosynthesis